MTTVVLDPAIGLSKETVIRHLAAKQIDSRPFFHPLSRIPAYRQTPAAVQARVANTIAYTISPYGVNLPCGLSITEAQVDFVCAALREVIANRERVRRLVA